VKKLSRTGISISMSMPRQLPRDVRAVNQSEREQTNAGKMLHAQERSIAQPPLAA
jgi:hypothetical protein